MLWLAVVVILQIATYSSAIGILHLQGEKKHDVRQLSHIISLWS